MEWALKVGWAGLMFVSREHRVGGHVQMVIISNIHCDLSVCVCAGKLLHELHEHLGVVRCLHINDERLVSGGDQKKVVIWDYRVSRETGWVAIWECGTTGGIVIGRPQAESCAFTFISSHKAAPT